MAWFLQTWAGYVPSVVALILGITFERYTRSQVRWLDLTLVCMCCVVTLGGGWLLQSILDEAFFSGVMATGVIYSVEFTPLSYLSHSVIGMIEFGLQCGPILAVLLINTRAKKTAISAMITGALVLIAQDVWLAINKKRTTAGLLLRPAIFHTLLCKALL